MEVQVMIKKIFSRDVGQAIANARQAERELCEKDKIDALNKQEQLLKGDHLLEVKSLKAELESMAIRTRELSAREKSVELERQKLREQAMMIHRIVSDLNYLSERSREENIERGQTISRLMEDAGKIQQVLIGG
jgi:hypothetical protein